MAENRSPQYKHTVRCFSDRSLDAHFEQMKDAIEHVNGLLAQGYKAKLYPFRPPKRYVDFLAENEEQFNSYHNK